MAMQLQPLLENVPLWRQLRARSSSTFGLPNRAYASLKTLDVMERERTWEIVTATGLEIRRRWQECAVAMVYPLLILPTCFNWLYF